MLAVGAAVDAVDHEPAVMAVEREPAVTCAPGNGRRRRVTWNLPDGRCAERQRRVTWNLPDGRSDMRDSKLRKRHMELVIARAICDRITRVNLQFKNTPENSFENPRANLAKIALANLRSRNAGANAIYIE